MHKKNKTMLAKLEKDCRDWISNNKEIFLDEHDMQGKLASYLANKYRCGRRYYDRVYVEYAVPLQSLRYVVKGEKKIKKIIFEEGNFPWNEDLFIDIVVEKKGKFAAVELKYIPTDLDDQDIDNVSSEKTIFGEENTIDIKEFITDAGGHNNRRYQYWKDVRRIEALTCFPNVVGGIALMVSNNSIYWTTPKDNENPDYAAFSMREGATIGSKKLNWKTERKSQGKASRSAFTLDKSYYCHWGNTKIQALAIKGKGKKKDAERSFRYIISVIPPESIKQQIKKVKKINR